LADPKQKEKELRYFKYNYLKTIDNEQTKVLVYFFTQL